MVGSKQRRCAFGCAGLIVASVTIAAASGAGAPSKFLDASPGLRRPADFYAVISAANPSVCRQILSSLNKKYRIDDEKLDDNPRVSWTSDSLLSLDLQFHGCGASWTSRMPSPTR